MPSNKCNPQNFYHQNLNMYHMHSTPPQPFYGPFPGPSGWAGARRGLLDFMVQGKINRGRHIDHPAGCHSIRTIPVPTSTIPIFFYRPDALPATKPTASKHWRQRIIHIRNSKNTNHFNDHLVAANNSDRPQLPSIQQRNWHKHCTDTLGTANVH